MPTAATARYPMPNTNTMGGTQLSEDDLEKLQEIHELINLMMRELPTAAQGTARSYMMPTPLMVPYAYSFHQFPWGSVPYIGPPGF